MAGCINAAAVNRMRRAGFFQHRAEELQFIRSVRRIVHEVPCRQRHIIRVARLIAHQHLSRRCRRMHHNKAMLIRNLVPLGIARVDFACAGIAVHREYQRNRLFRLRLDLLRYVNIPFAHPAADPLVMVFHTEVGHRVLCDAQVAARAAHPAALPVQEVLPNPTQQRIGIIRGSACDCARTNAERFPLLVRCIRRLNRTNICYRIRRSLFAIFGDAAGRAPVSRRTIVRPGRDFRIVDHPCRHRDLALFQPQTMGFVDKAVQIGAEIRCRRLAVVLRHLRATHTDHACPHGGIVHRRHVGHHAALAAAGQVELGFVYAELEALRTGEIHLLDIGYIAVRLAVCFVCVPHTVLRLEKEYDQLFLGLLGVRNHAPPAVAPEIIGGLAILRQDKHACRRRTRTLRNIHQIATFFSTNRYFFFKCTLIERLERVFRIYFILIVLIHCDSPCQSACLSIPLFSMSRIMPS